MSGRTGKEKRNTETSGVQHFGKHHQRVTEKETHTTNTFDIGGDGVETGYSLGGRRVAPENAVLRINAQ